MGWHDDDDDDDVDWQAVAWTVAFVVGMVILFGPWGDG